MTTLQPDYTTSVITASVIIILWTISICQSEYCPPGYIHKGHYWQGVHDSRVYTATLIGFVVLASFAFVIALYGGNAIAWIFLAFIAFGPLVPFCKMFATPEANRSISAFLQRVFVLNNVGTFYWNAIIFLLPLMILTGSIRFGHWLSNENGGLFMGALALLLIAISIQYILYDFSSQSIIMWSASMGDPAALNQQFIKQYNRENSQPFPYVPEMNQARNGNGTLSSDIHGKSRLDDNTGEIDSIHRRRIPLSNVLPRTSHSFTGNARTSNIGTSGSLPPLSEQEILQRRHSILMSSRRQNNHSN